MYLYLKKIRYTYIVKDVFVDDILIIFAYFVVNVDILQNAKDLFKQIKFVICNRLDRAFTIEQLINVTSELL